MNIRERNCCILLLDSLFVRQNKVPAPVGSSSQCGCRLRQSSDVHVYCEHKSLGLLFVVYRSDDKVLPFTTLSDF
jgi:hypothetical protein